MKKHAIVLMPFFLGFSCLFAQKMTVKDTDAHVLMEVNDEGDVGSITLPSGSAPDTPTYKLYNVSGTLWWNGSALGTAGNAGGWTDDGTVVRLATGTDKVGIGISSPNNQFQTSDALVGSDDGSAGGGYFYPISSVVNNAGGNDTGVGYGFGYFTGSVPLIDGTNQFAYVMGIPHTPGSQNYRGHLSFWTRNASGINERVRITEDGNVGIGTTDPDTKLRVFGEIKTGGNGGHIWAAAGDLKSGYAGGYDGAVVLGCNWDYNVNVKITNARPGLGLWGSVNRSSPDMVITTEDGYVGINKNDPAQALDVNGEIVSTYGFFHDRGDPASSDKATGDWTKDGNWYDWDLSSVVPAGAKAIVVSGYVTSSGAGESFMMRKNGNSNSVNMEITTTQVANINIPFEFIVPCDENRVIEYLFANSGHWTSATATVVGWFK